MKKLSFFLMIMLVVIYISCERNNPIMNLNRQSVELLPTMNLSKINTNPIIFGPVTFIRTKGKPKTEKITFTVQNPSNDFQLVLENGGADKNTKVSSCFVILNNDTIIYPINIDKDVDRIEVDISLLENNIIAIRVSGKPGSYITITIFNIKCPCTVTDIDGNVYQTVQIGDQCWMAENLKVTHYRNGDPISNVTDNTDWVKLTTGAYCEYNNDLDIVKTYGRFYNWYAVNDSRKIAPEGWHVPTDDEWKELEIYLGMSQAEADAIGYRGTDQGGKLKEAGTIHWDPPNTGATNETGFTGLPAGYRHPNIGIYDSMGSNTAFWNSNEYNNDRAWRRNLQYGNSKVDRNYSIKQTGISVRCVKD